MDISRLSVLLTGTINGFAAAMQQGKHELTGFAGVAHSVSEGLGIGSGIELIHKGVELATEALHKLKETFEEVGAMGRESAKLGLNVEDYSRLKFAADATHVSVEGLNGGFNKMLIAAEKASNGDKALAETFKTLGLNAQLIAAENPKDAFLEISQAISKMDNAAARANAIRELFGKGGGEMAPLLREGAQGIKELFDASDSAGFTQTEANVKKVEEAERALAIATDTVKGMFMDLAASAGPALKKLADGVSSVFFLLNQGSRANADNAQLNEQFHRTAEDVTAANAAMKEFFAHKADANGAKTGLDALAAQSKYVSDLTEQLREEKRAYDDLGQAGRKAEAADMLKRILADSSVLTGATKIRDALKTMIPEDHTKDISDFNKALTELQNKIRDFNLDEWQKKIKGLKGLDEKKVFEFDLLRAKLKGMEDEKKAAEKNAADQKRIHEEMAADANRLFAETRTPVEQYANELQKLDTLLHEGLISQETYSRGAAKAKDDLAKKDEDKHAARELPQLLEAGSQGAAKFVAQVKAQQQAHETQQAMLDQQVAAGRLLAQIAENTKGGSGSTQLSVANL